MRQPLLRRSGGSDEGGANDVRLSHVVDYGGPPPVLENIKSSIQDLQDGVVRRLSDDWGSLDQGAPRHLRTQLLFLWLVVQVQGQGSASLLVVM